MNDIHREPEFFKWIRAARRRHDKAVAGMTPEQRSEYAEREAAEIAKKFRTVPLDEARARLDALLSTPTQGNKKRTPRKPSQRRNPTFA